MTEQVNRMARLNFANLNKLVKSSTEEGVADSQRFLLELQSSIEKTEEIRKQKSNSVAYKPSSMNCVRMMYYYMTNTKKDEQSMGCELIGICESGTDRHERIQQAVIDMKNNGYDCEYINVADYIKENNIEDLEVISQNGYETKLWHKKLNLRFMCDGVIKYRGKYYILEIKTEASFKWQARTGVDEGHYTQACTYSHTIQIPEVMFLYENRDNCSKKCFIYKPTKEQIEELVLNKIKDCDTHINENRVPSIPASVTAKTCRYCDYKAVCKGTL